MVSLSIVMFFYIKEVYYVPNRQQISTAVEIIQADGTYVYLSIFKNMLATGI